MHVGFESVVKGAATIGQGFAAFVCGIALGYYLLLVPLGFVSITSPVITAVLLISLLLQIGTVLTFRMWIPALVGWGAALIVTFLGVILAVILSLLASIAFSGGQ